MVNRNRGRATDDDGSADEPVEDAYDDADLDDVDDLADDDLADDADEEDATTGRRSRAGAATRERTVSRDRTRKDADSGPGLFGRLARRFRETVAELQKVIWPTRKELLTYTTVVVIFVTIVMAYVAGLDVAFARLMFLVFGTAEE